MPALQYIDRPNWGSALGDFGSGFLDQYAETSKKRGEEDALTSMIEDAKKRRANGESEEDIIASMYGARGVPFEQKKSAAEMMSQASKNTRQKEVDAEKQKYDREQKRIAVEQKDRDLDIKEQKAGKSGDNMSFDEKKKRELTLKAEADIWDQMPEVDSSLRTIQQMRGLVEETTGFGTLNRRKQGQLRVAAAAVLKPIIKIYNPTGQVSQVKLQWIADKFMVSGNETRWDQRGKLDGLENLMKETQARLLGRKKLYDDWNGNPPQEDIRSYDNESEKIYDDITGWNERAAELGAFEPVSKATQKNLEGAPKDKVITNDKGNEFQWDGSQWIQTK